jgi:hypothetical protein
MSHLESTRKQALRLEKTTWPVYVHEKANPRIVKHTIEIDAIATSSSRLTKLNLRRDERCSILCSRECRPVMNVSPNHEVEEIEFARYALFASEHRCG